MKLSPLFKDDFWNVQIYWSRPSFYETVVNFGTDWDDDAYLYMIAGKYGSATFKILYIGKTYKQIVSERLNQEDHRRRYQKIKRKYPRHKLYVSHGIVEIKNGNINEKRIKEIEKILIYSNDTVHSQNVSNRYYHGIKDCYSIVNLGHKISLSKHLYLGIFSN